MFFNLQIKTVLPSNKTGLFLIKDPCSGSKTFNYGAKMHVRCDMERDGGGWIVIQRRITNGTVNFTRNWEDYKNGFGDLDGEFWIGLGNIYELTNQQEVDLQISVWNDNEARITWNYPTFRISGPDSQYRLTVSGGSGNSNRDAFAYNNGLYFTTYDRDHDSTKNHNCGYADQAGWWYKQCTAANLNGRHEPSGLPGTRSPEQRLIWKHGSKYVIYTNSEMKIRSKTCGLS